ncbi:MAG TPA: hypothetical protein VGK73_25790 [Polyangiaceae bacterium]
MKRFAILLVLGLSALGCRTECEEAVDHWEECVGRDDAGFVTEGECSGKNECYAKCINDAECLDLNKFSDPTSTYAQCTSKCQ